MVSVLAAQRVRAIKTEGGRKNQEKTLKRMMAYQKKAEQMVSRKRVNHHMIRKG